MCIYTVDSGKDEFLLQVTELLYIFARLLDLDLRVTSYDAETSAWSIEQNAIELGEKLWQFTAVLARDDNVADAKAMAIGVQTLQTLFLEVVCD